MAIWYDVCAYVPLFPIIRVHVGFCPDDTLLDGAEALVPVVSNHFLRAKCEVARTVFAVAHRLFTGRIAGDVDADIRYNPAADRSVGDGFCCAVSC